MALTTAHLNTQTNIKKLQYNAKKCNKIHIGNNEIVCPRNTIDTWKLDRDNDDAVSIMDLVDKEGDTHEMETVSSSKYLGDILQRNGKNDKNIKERVHRGTSAVTQIMMILEELCLGDYHFESANILRNSLLLNSLLSNGEAWYNVTENTADSNRA